MDFFTAEVLTLYKSVLFFIHLETRRVNLAGFTSYPDQEWMEQQALVRRTLGAVGSLSRLILFGESSLQRALQQYIVHYHEERN
jgi:hypothetical protein